MDLDETIRAQLRDLEPAIEELRRQADEALAAAKPDLEKVFASLPDIDDLVRQVTAGQ